MSSTKPRIQLDEILPTVYGELRKLASWALENERDGHSFQTTELVHEAYVRLAKIDRIQWHQKDDVLRAAVGVMRRVLIDHARARLAQKRNPNLLALNGPNIEFTGSVESSTDLELIALDEALVKLQQFDERKAEIVELRYFGGQEIATIARILGISTATVKRDWALAKAWLYRELSGDAP